MNSISCPLCNCTAYTYASSFYREGGDVNCAVCGVFSITMEAWMDNFQRDSLTRREKANLSASVYRRHKLKLTQKVIEDLLKEASPPLRRRLDDLIVFLSQQMTGPQEIEIVDSFRPIVWAESYHELQDYIDLLAESHQIVRNGSWCRLTLKGWERVHELTTLHGVGDQCFVAMSFSPSLDSIYADSIEPGILAAGYRPLRIDRSEHTNRIDDEIVAQIRRSRFMVVDFTEQKSGVYYEAGFAQGLGIPVIWCCSSSDIDNLHFDVRQYNCLLWSNDNLAEFCIRLRNRIESLIGPGAFTTKATNAT